MTAPWTRDEILTWFGCSTLTAGELALAPHDLDPTCTRATLETGEVYAWDNRRGLWVRYPGT
jgi:hypothetical protein